MSDYRPPAYKYQQLVYGGATGPFDCTAWTGAWLADAHTKGTWTTTGRAIRLASNEPTPDPDSPGLNQPQVDAAVYKLSKGRVNLELGGTWTPKAPTSKLTTWHYNGRPMGIAVNRGVLIDRMSDLGALNGFRGSHQVGIILDDGKSWLFDPLVKIYLPVNLPDVWAAAARLQGTNVGAGYAYALAARDIIPSHYEVVIDPAPEAFWTYRVDNGVAYRAKHPSVGADTRVVRDCVRAATFRYAGGGSRYLCRVTEGTGIAKSGYPYVSPDASAIHYRGVLP